MEAIQTQIPGILYQHEQPREYKDLKDLLAYYGPQIAAVMAESLRARQKAEDIQRKFHILMGAVLV